MDLEKKNLKADGFNFFVTVISDHALPGPAKKKTYWVWHKFFFFLLVLKNQLPNSFTEIIRGLYKMEKKKRGSE